MNLYMQKAIDLANENLKTKDGGPFGACVVKDGKIIGASSNQVIKRNDPTAHAEILAIREAAQALHSYDLSGCEIYTTCYPCPMCLSATIWSNVKKVYYGNTKEDAANIGFRDDYIYNYLNSLAYNSNDNIILELENIDREETIKSFNEFMQKNDKRVY